MAQMTVDPSDVERPDNAPLETSKRNKALSMRLAGMSFQEIGDHFGMTRQSAWELIHRALAMVPSRQADELRLEENLRLDIAQARIWSKVLDGDLKAVDAFLRISARRARMNGLDLAADVSVSVSVRQDLDVALKQLEEVIKGEVVDRPAE
jgi:predicted DNA-binding protein YlxM (UPF0122 family)